MPNKQLDHDLAVYLKDVQVFQVFQKCCQQKPSSLPNNVNLSKMVQWGFGYLSRNNQNKRDVKKV